MSLVHYSDVIMGAIASQITSRTIVYSIVYSDADQRKHQSSASLTFVRGIHWGPVNSLHKWPVTRKMFSFDDVIMSVCDGNTEWLNSGLQILLSWRYNHSALCLSQLPFLKEWLKPGNSNSWGMSSAAKFPMFNSLHNAKIGIIAHDFFV